VIHAAADPGASRARTRTHGEYALPRFDVRAARRGILVWQLAVILLVLALIVFLGWRFVIVPRQARQQPAPTSALPLSPPVASAVAAESASPGELAPRA
jgi:hypothetical protein